MCVASVLTAALLKLRGVSSDGAATNQWEDSGNYYHSDAYSVAGGTDPTNDEKLTKKKNRPKNIVYILPKTNNEGLKKTWTSHYRKWQFTHLLNENISFSLISREN